MKQKRVFWKTDETAKMVDWLIAKDIRSSSTEFLELARMGQAALFQPERRKTIGTRAHIQKLIEELDAEWKRRGNKPGLSAAPKVVEEVEETEPEVEALEPVSVPEAPKPKPVLGGSLDSLVEQLATAFAEKFVAHVKMSLESLIAQEFSGVVKHTAGLNLKAPVKTRQLKVLVVGLKPQQAGIINQEYPDLDMRFVDSGRSAAAVHGKTEADYIIGMTDFLDHSTDGNLYKASENYIRCGGGMTKLRETLTRLRAPH